MKSGYNYVIAFFGIGYFCLFFFMMQGLLEVKKEYIASIALSSTFFTISDFFWSFHYYAKKGQKAFIVGHYITLILGIFSLIFLPHLPSIDTAYDKVSDEITIYGFSILLIYLGVRQLIELFEKKF